MTLAERISPPGHARIVTDESVEKALDYLRDSAGPIGDAKARTVLAGHMVKIVEALMIKDSEATSDSKRQANARASSRYHEAIMEDAIAAGEIEKLRSLRDAAAARIEAWRSEQANYRSMKI